MIFKTYNTALDSFDKRLGFSKRTFADWRNDIQSATIGNQSTLGKLTNGMSAAFTVSKGQIQDVDSIVPKLSEEDAAQKIKELVQYDKKIKSDEISWQDVYKTYNRNDQGYIAEWGASTEGKIRKTEDLIAVNNTARQSIIDQNAAIKSQTLSAKAGAFAINALAMAGNMLVMWGIGQAISFAVTKLDELAHASEYCAERAENLMNAYDSSIQTANNNAKSIESISNRYEELSKGVNNLGQNISLSTDDFAEYNNITNQIAETIPNLISGYTKEGDAILSLRGNVDLLRDSYKQAQKEAYALLTSNSEQGNPDDIIQTFHNTAMSKDTNYKDSIHMLEKFATASSGEKMLEIANKLENENFALYHGETMSNALQEIGIEEIIDSNWNLDSEQLAKIKSRIATVIRELEISTQAELSKISTISNAFLMTNDDYALLDETAQNAVSILVNSLDVNIAEKFQTKSDIGTYVQNTLDALAHPADRQNLINLFKLDTSEISLREAKASIDELIHKIAASLNSNPEELKLRLNFNITDELYDNLNTVTKNGAKHFTSNYSNINQREKQDYIKTETTNLEEFAEQNSINTQDEIAFWNTCIEESKSRQEAMDKYLNSDIKNSKDPLSFKESVNLLINMGENLEVLNSSYRELIDNSGRLSAKSIQEIIDTFSQFEGIDIDQFSSIITNPLSTVEEQQDAFSRLQSEYILSSDLLQELNDQNVDFVSSELEALGVTNARALVTGYLAMQKEYLAATGNLLADASINEIQQLINESTASDVAKQALAQLALTKFDVNQNQINTSADIDNVIGLANAAGASAASLARLANAKSVMSTVETQGLDGSAADFHRYEGAQTTIRQINNGTFDFDYTPLDPNSFKASSSGGSGGSGSPSGSSPAAREVSETFNWIDNLLDKIKSKISDTIESIKEKLTFNSIKNATKQAFQELTNTIQTVEKALTFYQDKANSVGLSQDYIEKIQNGSMDVQTITDEGLINQIKEYENWYKKIQDCNKELKDLKKQQSEIAQESLKAIQSLYNRKIDRISSEKKKTESSLEKKESRGGYASSNDYKKLISSTRSEKNLLTKQEENLSAQLNNMVKSGYIKKYSEEWYEWKKNIDSCTTSITDCDKSLSGYYKTLKNLPLDVASRKIEKLGQNMDLLDAKLGNAKTYTSKNKIIDQQTKNTKAEKNANKKAALDANKNYRSDKRKLSNTLNKSKSKKKLKNAVKKAMKANKPISAALLNQLEKSDKKAYEQALAYNASLEAKTESNYNYQLSVQNEKKSIQQNTKEKYNNIKYHYDSVNTQLDSKLSLADAKLNKVNTTGKSLYKKKQTDTIYDVQKNLLTDSYTETKAALKNKQNERNKYSKKKIENQYKKGQLSREDYLAQMAYINELDAEILGMESSLSDIKASIQDIQITKLSDELNTLTSSAKSIQDTISLNESKGRSSSAADYNALISNSKAQETNLKAQNKLLEKQQKQYEKGSEKYKELESQIKDNSSAIIDAQKNQEEWNRTLRDLPTDLLNKTLDTLEKLHNVYNALLDLRDAQGLTRTSEEIQTQIDNNTAEIQNQEKTLTTYKKSRDSIAPANADEIKRYDDLINETQAAILSLKAANEKLTDSFIQIRIDALQKEKDALQKVNDASDRRIALEKAQYEYERLKTQRTKRVFNGSSFVYEVDQEALKNAQSNLEALEFDELIHSIDDAIEDLENLKPEYNLYDKDGNSLNEQKVINATENAADKIAQAAQSIIEAYKTPVESISIEKADYTWVCQDKCVNFIF